MFNPHGRIGIRKEIYKQMDQIPTRQAPASPQKPEIINNFFNFNAVDIHQTNSPFQQSVKSSQGIVNLDFNNRKAQIEKEKENLLMLRHQTRMLELEKEKEMSLSKIKSS